MKRLNKTSKTKMSERWKTIQGVQDSVVRQGIKNQSLYKGQQEAENLLSLYTYYHIYYFIIKKC